MLKVKQLGLAAYIKQHGIELLEVSDGYFIFNTTATLNEWRTKYANSCCSKHDSMVCELRQFIKKGAV